MFAADDKGWEGIVRNRAEAYVVTPRHNCHAPIHNLAAHSRNGCRADHLWTLLALGALGENGCACLGPDLAGAGF